MTEKSFVEVDNWVDEFFPQDEKDHRKYLVNCVGQHAVDDVETRFQNLVIPSRETDFYQPLCNIFNTLLSKISSDTSMLFHQTSDRPENADHSPKPSICLFLSPTERFLLPGKDLLADAHWSWIEFPVEVEVNPKLAPFNFDNTPLRIHRTDDEGRRSRAQLTKYASEVQLHQHRTWAVTVWIQREWARLLLWDRNGAVVSRAINFTADPIPFMSFLCRYATASRADRGHDPTVERATTAQVASLQKYADMIKAEGDKMPAALWYDQYLQDMLQDLDRYPIDVLSAPDELSGREHAYLVGSYRIGPRDHTGLACKSYVAYDIESSRLVWLKDYWCADGQGIWSEAEIYRHLKKHSVQNIPTFVAGGDVGGSKAQLTRSDRYLNRKLKRSLRPRYHQRVILKELCRSLESHTDERELISCLRDAAVAHQDGCEKAGFLHRDVSPGNILIDIATNKGLLSDWELAKPLDKLHGLPGRPNRSGTWVSMSSLLQLCPYKPYEVTDDLESFLHITDYMATQFYEHNFSPKKNLRLRGIVNLELNSVNSDLAGHIFTRFYASRTVQGCTVGEQARSLYLSNSSPSIMLYPAESPLALLLKKLYKLFSPLYAPIYVMACRDKWGLAADLQAEGPELPHVERPTSSDLVKAFDEHATMTTGHGANRVGDQFLSLPTPTPFLPTIATGSGSKRSRSHSESDAHTAPVEAAPSGTLTVVPPMKRRRSERSPLGGHTVNNDDGADRGDDGSDTDRDVDDDNPNDSSYLGSPEKALVEKLTTWKRR